MAKKSVRQSIKPEQFDSIINSLYDTGVLQSTIFHTVVLLAMALTFCSESPVKQIHLHLSFGSDSTDSSFDRVDIAELDKLIEINDTKIDIASDTANIDTNPEIDISSQILEESMVSPTTVETISIADLNKQIEVPVQSNEEPAESNNAVTETGPQVRELAVSDFRPNASSSGPSSGIQNNIRGVGGAGGRNNVFNGGIGDMQSDIGARLSKAGAQTGDIQVSISWNTRDDIDLHVMHMSGIGQVNTISWMQRRDAFGGMLDVDMNAHPYVLTDKPVENIFWPHGASPRGQYVVAVHFFANWSRASHVPVLIVIKNGSNIETIHHTAVFGQNPQQVYRFKR